MMNLSVLALLIDSAAIILLVAVIFYSIRLNKYFTLLRDGKHDLARQLSAFADSTKRAEEAINRMKTSTHESASLLDQQIRRAELVRKDLSRNANSNREVNERLGVGSNRRKTAEIERERDSPSQKASGASGNSRVASSARSRLLQNRRANAEERQHQDNADVDSGGELSRKQRSKSKSELLKALQGMR